jgi:hypothetical protein
MRHRFSIATGKLALVITAAAALMLSAASFAGATPTLGSDCGAGASIVGSNSAGKVTLGATPATCTVTFTTPYANAPACSGTNETNSGNAPVPVANLTTTSTVVLNAYIPWSAGDVISYSCQSY